jgi:lysozyme family protein
MTEALALALREIANSLISDETAVLRHSELQSKLDGLRDEGHQLAAEDIEDVLYVELVEVNFFDDLPEEIQPQMARNAWDLGEQRATILLQAALNTFNPQIHITGTLIQADIDTAAKLAEDRPGQLVDLLNTRRLMLNERLNA